MNTEYIESEAVIKRLEKIATDYMGNIGKDGISSVVVRTLYLAINEIQNVKKSDAVPVIHGQWIENRKLWLPECSVCEARPFKGYIPSIDEVKQVYRFCPNCGAKMERKESGDDKLP